MDDIQQDNTTSDAQTFTDEESEIEAGVTQSYKTFELGSISSGTPLTSEQFAQFKDAVFSSRPSIKELYEQYKDTPFFNYSKSHVRENRNPIMRERKSELIGTVKEEVRKVLGSAIAESVAKQLKTNDSISTVQKDAPISHPDTFNATLMNSLPYFNAQHPSFANVLVFSCAGISFNNTKFPRGHVFHTISQETVHTNILTLFGHTVDSRPVLFNPPYSPEGVTDAKNSLQQLQRDGKIHPDHTRSINKLLDEIYAAPHPLSADDYVDQLTLTNYHLFRKLFINYPKNKPSLVYLSQEKIALSLLRDHHLHKDTLIHRMLFDDSLYPLIEKYFDGLTGAFVKDKKIGTFLFWGIPKEGKYRTQLWRDGNRLVSEDGSIRIELTPQAIAQAIHNHEIFPSVLLSFVILALYYGLILGGGYEQTFYLTRMKERFVEFVTEIGDMQSAQAVDGLLTTNLVIPRPLLTYLQGPQDSRIPASILDVLLYGDQGKSWNTLLDASKQVTMGQLIERTLPSLYREYTMHKPGVADFSQVTERDVEKLNGLDEKIPAIARLT